MEIDNMPMYNFLCNKCESIWEVQVSLDEIDKKLECPDCKETLKKMLSAPAFKVN